MRPSMGLDLGSLAVMAAVFIAVALALEGALLLWQMNRSAAAKRMRRRLQAWLPQLEEPARTPHAPVPWLPAALQARLLRSLEQAGWAWSPAALLALCAALALLGALLGLMLAGRGGPTGGPGTPSLTLNLLLGLGLVAGGATLLGSAPLMVLAQRRRARLRQIALQLPGALDLMARALRSGHAFGSAVQMVAQEAPQPVAQAFGLVAEQIGWGRDVDDALEDLTQRVPLDDVRFLVVAVRLQRQTGGQLAEVLGNLAELVRQRQRLLDRVRVLTAEGRLSAQVLGAMPLVTAGVIYLIRPEFIRVLWTDPAGWRWLQASALLFVMGVIWLWRMTRIRV